MFLACFFTTSEASRPNNRVDICLFVFAFILNIIFLKASKFCLFVQSLDDNVSSNYKDCVDHLLKMFNKN